MEKTSFLEDHLSKKLIPKTGLFQITIERRSRNHDTPGSDFFTAEDSLLKKKLRTKLVETTDELEINCEKMDYHMESVKSFDQLETISPDLLRGVYAMGYSAPTKIQAVSLPYLLHNPPLDAIVQAENGTGKTVASLLSSLSRIDTSENHPQALILSPTYELSLQTGEVAKMMAQFSPITFMYAIRGETVGKKQVTEHVVLGTPGKVLDWALKHRYFDIKKVKVFVLDEADVMISAECHYDQCIRIRSLLSSECQFTLISAYLKDVTEFTEQIISSPIIIRQRRVEKTLSSFTHYLIYRRLSYEVKCDKPVSLHEYISTGKTIIFCRKEHNVTWLQSMFEKDYYSVAYLSTNMEAEEQRSVIDSFKAGSKMVLITTKVCEKDINLYKWIFESISEPNTRLLCFA